jgi:hypothetical protein
MSSTLILAQDHLTWKHANIVSSGQNDLSISGRLAEVCPRYENYIEGHRIRIFTIRHRRSSGFGWRRSELVRICSSRHLLHRNGCCSRGKRGNSPRTFEAMVGIEKPNPLPAANSRRPFCFRQLEHIRCSPASSEQGSVRVRVMFLRDAVHPSERFMAAKRKAHDQLSRKRLELRRGVWGFYTNECGQS